MKENDSKNTRTESADWRNPPPVRWELARENEQSRTIARVLYKWILYMDQNFKDWDKRPHAGFFLDGAGWYGFETSYPMYVYAVMGAFSDKNDWPSALPRELLEERAIKALRFLCFTHDSGPIDCVRPIGKNKWNSGQKWGGKNAPYFQATQTGTAVFHIAYTAWLFWEKLDEETRQMVAELTIGYAERWSQAEPRDGSFHDTQMEENAWTATGILAAVMLFPRHPRHEAWSEAYDKWNLNTATVPEDRFNGNLYKGEPLSDKWIQTVTLFPDFTNENHGMVHPDYMATAITFRACYAIASFTQGKPLDDTMLLNNKHIYEQSLKRWTQFDGMIVPIQSQDWWYNRQTLVTTLHAFMNVIHRDPDAALLEQQALAATIKLQQSNETGCLIEKNGELYPISPNDYQTAEDFESMYAFALANAYVLHVLGGPGVSPSKKREMQSRLADVYMYPYGSAVVHRTENTFSSFSWRNRVMAITLPSKGLWTITPIENSYIGKVVFEGSEENISPASGGIAVKSESQRINPSDNGFGASACVEHGEGSILQRIAWVSLPDGSSVYAEQFTVVKPCRVAAMHTGLLGVRNERYKTIPELAPGRRNIHIGGKTETFDGFFGRDEDITRRFPPVPYINVDDEIGYLLFGTNGIRYDNRHQYPKWKGIEDCLVLNDKVGAAYVGGEILQPFIAVTLPNRTAMETKEALAHYHQLEASDNGMIIVETDKYMIYANLMPHTRNISGTRRLSTSSIAVFGGTVRVAEGMYSWTYETAGQQAGFLESDCRLEASSMSSADLQLMIAAGQTMIVNCSTQNEFIGEFFSSAGRVPIILAPGGGMIVKC
ncbi:hypothetical protein [Paenibacillus contaminans]|uniref:Uncharacterized protein n=1 Tax=Paenibacillus contaminans TaxID=450362 RepID=A0A329MTU8_9BACL|nr:hypothetical protein [Paenibacillus contaminans]RAV23052.1 hypothetical protein DQG23_02295 [Paenibacillus contaminans]